MASLCPCDSDNTFLGVLSKERELLCSYKAHNFQASLLFITEGNLLYALLVCLDAMEAALKRSVHACDDR